MTNWVRSALNDAIPLTTALDAETHADLKRIVSILETSCVHHFRTEANEAFADRLEICDDPEEYLEIMQEVTIASGFQHFTISVIKHGMSVGFMHRLVSSWPIRWLSKYQQNAYLNLDPILALARTRDEAFEFNEDDFKNPILREYIMQYEACGIGQNGICYPILKKNGSVICVIFYDANPPQIAKRRIARHSSDLQVLSLLATDCFVDLFSINKAAQVNPLSESETLFLYCLITQINTTCALSVLPEYGSNRALRNSIAAKLDVSSAYQAAAIAATNGWFDDLPFTASDVKNIGRSLIDIDIDLIQNNRTVAAAEKPVEARSAIDNIELFPPTEQITPGS